MIIKSYEDIPYYRCRIAEIRPKDKESFSGSLEAGGETYQVRISHNIDEDESIPRVWARVHLIERIPGESRADFAMEVAQRARVNADWAPVKVDLRDGETAYMRTWTYDYPDDAAMDAFLGAARRFIEGADGAKLRSMVPGPAKIDIEDLLGRF